MEERNAVGLSTVATGLVGLVVLLLALGCAASGKAPPPARWAPDESRSPTLAELRKAYYAIPPELEAAFQRLAGASAVEPSPIDANGAPTEATRAFRAIQGSSRGYRLFERLAREAAPAGEIYGLCGIRALSPCTFDHLVASHSATLDEFRDRRCKVQDVLAGECTRDFPQFCTELAGIPRAFCVTQSTIVSAMRSVAPHVRACCEEANACGTVMVGVQVTDAGRTVSAKVTGKHAGTPLADCIEAATATMKVGAWQDISYPWPWTCSACRKNRPE